MSGTIPLVFALPHKLPELVREPVEVPVVQKPPAECAAAPDFLGLRPTSPWRV
ncbi:MULTISPECIES: hypothetical protein [unclassified Megasphaera]|uniref:hypothetical protein n=1 Tax=unclassified Megasphaera TaxID=2626256 RepID=UPI00178C6C04|nr:MULTISPECIES: hypothetical protein [unclassified Megasphaera]